MLQILLESWTSVSKLVKRVDHLFGDMTIHTVQNRNILVFKCLLRYCNYWIYLWQSSEGITDTFQLFSWGWLKLTYGLTGFVQGDLWRHIVNTKLIWMRRRKSNAIISLRSIFSIKEYECTMFRKLVLVLTTILYDIYFVVWNQACFLFQGNSHNSLKMLEFRERIRKRK